MKFEIFSILISLVDAILFKEDIFEDLDDFGIFSLLGIVFLLGLTDYQSI